MEDVVSEMIEGLGTSGCGIIFVLEVLVGAYSIFKKIFSAFLSNNFNQTNIITKSPTDRKISSYISDALHNSNTNEVNA